MQALDLSVNYDLIICTSLVTQGIAIAKIFGAKLQYVNPMANGFQECNIT